jgi:endonuclease G
MAKKKKKKTPNFLVSRSLLLFFLGIALGIASQRIPLSRAYTNEVLLPIEHQFSTESEIDGHPTSVFQIDRSGYSLAYDARNRNPAWVYEHLTANGLKGSISRLHSQFKEDEIITTHLRVTLADYKGSGFDRGHMAPAADHKATIKSMNDTFFLSNRSQSDHQVHERHFFPKQYVSAVPQVESWLLG